jgi:tRNA threonylcarbamoyladenosine biosynthesis protein TsaE
MTNPTRDKLPRLPSGKQHGSDRELTLDTTSPEGTIRLGAAIGRLCEPNTTIALQGPLGAGKTQLTKGIAEGLGITDRGRVTSPTFVLEQEYDGRLKIRHLDAYRLTGPADLWDIGIDEMCKAGGVVVLEWPERAAEALPRDTLWVYLEPTGEQSRRLRFISHGTQSAKLLERLRKAVDAGQF